MSISRLESQLLQQVESARMEGSTAPSLTPTQRHLVQYAFRDFVNFFLQLEQLAEAARKQKMQAMASPSATPATLTTTALHLDIRVEAYETESAPTQPVTVHKLQNESGQASLIQVYLPKTDLNGAVSYQVTTLKLAVSLDTLAQTPEMAQGGQTGLLTPVESGGSAGDSLQDFLNRSPHSQTAGHSVWAYQHEDALDLLHEEARLQDWKEQQHLQALIEAAYEIMGYLGSGELQAAFGMSEEEKELMANALERDPAEVAQAVLKSFIRKKRMELEMLRKELKERQEIEEAKHKTERIPPQFRYRR